ncbi:hypothetical protein FGM00_11840 [Aggregatimonas sangjinii]|uniref:Uncharacterized protein n=1 Tax=Aggregatimonas sangjinii TaxID=2583587 RepID=A0A5B7SQ01_9FLAO|nr:hypothetical protein [Aggregatimonas sangjinii]QCX00765.1 hypothetical protein FGM00_11840 [Aggregatimonas sangjinii]
MKCTPFIPKIFFFLFFSAITFGQNSEDDTAQKIKSIETLYFGKNNQLENIGYQTFNLDGEITYHHYLKADSTQVFRRAFTYNAEGLLEYEESYTIEDDTLPSVKLKSVYDETGRLLKKIKISDFEQQKIFNEDGIIVAERTISSVGKTTGTDIYIYEDDLLMEIQSLDKNDTLYARKLFKYNDLKQKIGKIEIARNKTRSKEEYVYNENGDIIERLYFQEKKEKLPPKNPSEIINTEVTEVAETVIHNGDDSIENTDPMKWVDWKEKELYSSVNYVRNEHGDVVSNTTKRKGVSEAEIYDIPR